MGLLCANYHDDPVKCLSSFDNEGKYCVYTAGKVHGEIGQCRKSIANNVEKSKENARRRKKLQQKISSICCNESSKRYRSKKI